MRNEMHGVALRLSRYLATEHPNWNPAKVQQVVEEITGYLLELRSREGEPQGRLKPIVP